MNPPHADIVKEMAVEEDLAEGRVVEPLYFSDEADEFMHRNVADVLTRCIEFKQRPPINRNSHGKFILDTSAIEAASQIAGNGQPLAEVINEFEETILKQSLNFNSPSFLAHPDNGCSTAGVVGDLARAMMHQNMVSYEYSPAATHAEYSLLRQLRKIVGYGLSPSLSLPLEQGYFGNYVFGMDEGQSNDFSVDLAGGAFVFGGTNANFASLLAAREALKRRLSKQGRMFDPRRTRILTKVPFAHYSMRRAYTLLGLGNEDLSHAQIMDSNLPSDVRVNVDSINFRMDVVDLERKIEATLRRGDDIMCIFAIAGDSRMMSFDDLTAITKVAERYDIWVHVDACEGGQCLFSPVRRTLMDGIERANSISLDPHKVLMVPYSLSAFFLRDIEDMSLIDANTSLIRLGTRSLGSYTPNIGSKDFASLRLWFMLKHWGWQKLAEEIERRHDLALKTMQLINDTPKLTVINPDVEHNAVAFVYAPALKGDDAIDIKSLNDLNKRIHHRLNSETNYYIHMMSSRDDCGVVSEGKEEITILRMMFGNPATTPSIVERCLQEIVRIGDAITCST